MLHIKNALIYTMNKDLEVIENGSILIEDGKIKDIGKDIKVDDGVEVIDAEGKMLLPGFVDAHSHIGLSENAIGTEGRDHNERINPITPEMRALDGINPMDYNLEEAYRAGVTSAVASTGSANVIGGTSVAIKLYGKRIDKMVIKNPVAMKTAMGENPKRVYGGSGKAPATRMGIAAVLRETLFKAKDYLEKKENGDNPAFDMKMEAMLPVMKKEIPLKIHAHRADDILTAIRIVKEFDLDMTIDHCTEGQLIADELAEEGFPAIVGPSFGRRSKFELKNKSFITPKVLVDKGIKIAITTDSPVVPLDQLPLCAGLAVDAGLDEMEAFKAITINPAEIVGIDDRVGSLEVGKDADLAIFEGNPIKDIQHKVHYTLIDGKIVHKLEE